MGITVGAVLNIGLDPLLIFVFRLGIAGAAIATIFSQLVSFTLLLVGCSRGGNLRIRFSRLRLERSYFLLIVQGGLPSLARQGLASLAAIVLNRAAGGYGDAAIAAMSVVSRAMMTAASALIGFGQGFQPVCGFNYGARLWSRVREGFWFCVRASSVFLAAVSVLGFAFAPQIIAVFRNDPDVIAYGATALRLQCITFALNGWVMISNMLMSIEKVRAYFKGFGIEDRILEFPVSSATVELAAKALNVEGARIAKTLSFKLGDRILLIVCAGDAKVDNRRYKDEFGGKASMLSHDEAATLVGHAVGGVCPFAVPDEVEVYLDESMKRFHTVYPAAGSSNSAIELTMDELEKYSKCRKWVDVCKGWRPEELA